MPDCPSLGASFSPSGTPSGSSGTSSASPNTSSVFASAGSPSQASSPGGPWSPKNVRVAVKGATFVGETVGNQDFLSMISDEWGGSTYSTFWSTATLPILKKILEEVDRNGDHHITQEEIDSVTIVLAGYSWGGTTLVNVVQKLNQVGSHYFGVKLHPSDPQIRYKVYAPIEVKRLVLVDPVRFARPDPGTVPSNVEKFINWYQTKGGNAIFVDPATGFPDPSGTILSRLLKGFNPSSNAATNEIVNVGADKRWNYKTTTAGDRLYGKYVNHDFMPYFCKDCIKDELTP